MSAHLDPCLSCNARNYESTARGQYPDARRRSTSSRATSTPIDDRFHHPTRTRTFASSSSPHRSRRMFGFTLCLHRCAHCCPVRVPMTRAMSLHRFPCSRCNASKSSSSRVDHGRVSRASSLGIARGKREKTKSPHARPRSSRSSRSSPSPARGRVESIRFVFAMT